MNKQQVTKILMKSRLMSRNSGKGKIITSGGNSGCTGCGKKKTEQSINRIFSKRNRG